MLAHSREDADAGGDPAPRAGRRVTPCPLRIYTYAYAYASYAFPPSVSPVPIVKEGCRRMQGIAQALRPS